MFCESIIKNSTCSGHYCMTILRGRLLYLVLLPRFGCLLRHLPFRYVAVCRLCVRVSGVPVCGLSAVCPVYLSLGCLQSQFYQII
jgi:hypothetical protein